MRVGSDAHRLVCWLVRGEPNDATGYYSLHTCGVKHCIRAAHLKWGNQQQNAAIASTDKRDKRLARAGAFAGQRLCWAAERVGEVVWGGWGAGIGSVDCGSMSGRVSDPQTSSDVSVVAPSVVSSLQVGSEARATSADSSPARFPPCAWCLESIMALHRNSPATQQSVCEKLASEDSPPAIPNLVPTVVQSRRSGQGW